MLEILEICLGACGGAICRFGVSKILNPIVPLLPMGTLLANWLGSLAMGLIMGILQGIPSIAGIARPLLMTGFLGSFTTFSTFSAEAGQLLLNGKMSYGALLITLHVGGSILLFIWGLHGGVSLGRFYN